MQKLLENAIKESIKLVGKLGVKGRRNIPNQEKRSCLAEKEIHKLIYNILGRRYKDFELITEGFSNLGNPDSALKFTLDPLDGTMYYVRQKSATPISVTIALAAYEGERYQDAIAGALGNIYSREIWSFGQGSKPNSNKTGRLKTGGNEKHDPLLLFDFYYPLNAKARLKLKHPINPKWDRFESLNLGSAAEMMCKVACGEADAFINLTGLSTYEVLATLPIVKMTGGWCLSSLTGKDLGLEKINFESKIPIIAAKDKKLAQKLYQQVKSVI